MSWEGAGKLWGASGSFPSPAELKEPRAPEDLQVGMLVWSILGLFFHRLWKQRALRGAPRAEGPQEKPWKGKSCCSRLLHLLQTWPWAASKEFPGRMQCWIPGGTRRIPEVFSSPHHSLCSVLRAGVVFVGPLPAIPDFHPSLMHTQAFPGGGTCSQCPISV